MIRRNTGVSALAGGRIMKQGEGRKGLKTWPVLVLLLVTSFFLQACVSGQQAGKGAEISIFYHGVICRPDIAEPIVAWFGQRSDLHELDDDFFQGLDPSVVATLMSFDFSGNGILLLSPGSRGQEKYDIRLSDSVLDIVDQTALLQLKFIKKRLESEKAQNQSCTPSVLLKVPKGDYHHIQACDEKGLFMVKIRIP